MSYDPFTTPAGSPLSTTVGTSPKSPFRSGAYSNVSSLATTPVRACRGINYAVEQPNTDQLRAMVRVKLRQVSFSEPPSSTQEVTSTAPTLPNLIPSGINIDKSRPEVISACQTIASFVIKHNSKESNWPSFVGPESDLLKAIKTMASNLLAIDIANLFEIYDFINEWLIQHQEYISRLTNPYVQKEFFTLMQDLYQFIFHQLYELEPAQKTGQTAQETRVDIVHEFGYWLMYTIDKRLPLRRDLATESTVATVSHAQGASDPIQLGHKSAIHFMTRKFLEGLATNTPTLQAAYSGSSDKHIKKLHENIVSDWKQQAIFGKYNRAREHASAWEKFPSGKLSSSKGATNYKPVTEWLRSTYFYREAQADEIATLLTQDHINNLMSTYNDVLKDTGAYNKTKQIILNKEHSQIYFERRDDTSPNNQVPITKIIFVGLIDKIVYRLTADDETIKLLTPIPWVVHYELHDFPSPAFAIKSGASEAEMQALQAKREKDLQNWRQKRFQIKYPCCLVIGELALGSVVRHDGRLNPAIYDVSLFLQNVKNIWPLDVYQHSRNGVKRTARYPHQSARPQQAPIVSQEVNHQIEFSGQSAPTHQPPIFSQDVNPQTGAPQQGAPAQEKDKIGCFIM